jgi:hypothetical protein
LENIGSIFPLPSEFFKFNWKSWKSNENLLKKGRYEDLFDSTNVVCDKNNFFRIISLQIFGNEKYFKLINLFVITEYVSNLKLYENILKKKNMNSNYFLTNLFEENFGFDNFVHKFLVANYCKTNLCFLTFIDKLNHFDIIIKPIGETSNVIYLHYDKENTCLFSIIPKNSFVDLKNIEIQTYPYETE